VSYRTDLQNLRTTYKLKLPHPSEEGSEQAAATERQKEKKNTTLPPGETTTELLFKYQHQDWMMEE
jgi:hypothetical protein